MVNQTLPDIAEIFDCYSSFSSTVAKPDGLFVFHGELNQQGMATTVAANIAGAASLSIDADADHAKLSLRQGICDFVVNSLDEALRILKNEIRKQQSVAVGLVGNPAEIVAEMLERGVQPDLVTADGMQSEKFVEHGAKVVSRSVIARDSYAITWSVSQDTARWLPLVDAIAIETLKDDARVKWLQSAPRYLPKQLSRERYVRMAPDERAKFTELLQQRRQSDEIAVHVEVLCDGQPIT